MAFQTEREFVLPRGYLDDEGTLHRDGVMRLATAADEILPLREPAVQKNPAYATVVILSRVVTKLGNVPLITPTTIENLFAVDVAHLQDVYNEMNHGENGTLAVSCPNCDHEFEVSRSDSGES